MATTTKEKVLAIAPHLEDMSDTGLDMIIEDAAGELAGTELEGNERAERYLAAHFGTLSIRRAKSEKVENVSVTYEQGSKADGYEGTAYGQEFLRIAQSESGPTFMVFS